MKRLLPLLCALFVCNIALWAAPVDEAAARRIAAEFAAGTPSLRSGGGQGAATLSTAYVAVQPDGGAAYYVFNRGRARGFVIVAGDDRAEAVLGYADRGAFHPDSIPPAMRWWLGEYAKQMEALPDEAAGRVTIPRHVRTAPTLQVSGAEAAQPMSVARLKQAEEVKVVLPLLGDILYGQNSPYNLYTPVIDGRQSPTGCVATAMVQIMRYHQHPLQGVGTHSYTVPSTGQTLSADFGATTYDWGNMLSAYRGVEYTQEQAEAVATLMYHAGVAVEMQYKANESGAYDVDVPQALHEYFGYDGGMRLICRDYHTAEAWEDYVRTELDAARPVYYSGQAPEGGHAFVCDGYDASGYYHFNWGWDGSFNGYFLLDALEPAGQGTGGYEGGYNTAQMIVIGIRPDEGGVCADEEIEAKGGLLISEESIGRNDPFTWSTEDGIYNYGWQPVEGVSLRLLYYDATGALAADGGTIYGYTNADFEPNYGWRPISGKTSYVPEALPDGTYTLHLGVSTRTNPEWRAVPVHRDFSPYVNVKIENGTVWFDEKKPVPYKPKVSLLAARTESPATVKQYTDINVTATLSNEGTAWTGELGVYLVDAEGYMVTAGVPVPCAVEMESETQVTLTCNAIDLPAGEYELRIGKPIDDGFQDQPFDDGSKRYITVQTNAEGPTEPIVRLYNLAFSDTFEQNKEYDFTAQLRNVGTAYTGNIYAMLLDADRNVVYEQSVPATLPQGENADVDFTGWNVGDLPVGTYRMFFAYMKNGEKTYLASDYEQVINMYVIENVIEYELKLTGHSLPYAIAQGKPYTVELSLQNIGELDYDGAVYLEYQVAGEYETMHRSAMKEVRIPSGESLDVTINEVANEPLEAGKAYFVSVGHMKGENPALISVLGYTQVRDLPDQYMVGTSTDLPDELAADEAFTASTVLRNDGTERYTDDLALALLSLDGSAVYFTPSVRVDIPAGGSQPVQFAGDLSRNIIQPGDYMWVVGSMGDGYFGDFLYMDNGEVTFSVTIKEGGDTPVDPDLPEVYLPEATTDLPNEVTAGGTFTASTVVKNNGTATFTADVLLAMLNSSQTAIAYNTQPVRVSVPAGGTQPIQFTEQLPAKVSPGNYVWVVSTLDGEYLGDFLPVENGNNAFPVTVKKGGTPSEPELTLVEAESTLPAAFAQQTDYPMTLTLRNDGADFTGEVYAILWDGKGTLYHEQAIPATVRAGQKVKLDYTWNVGMTKPGQHVFSYALLVGDTYHFIPFDDGQGTTGVYATVTANADAPKLSLLRAQTELPSVVYRHTDFTVSSVVQNTGKTAFEGRLSFLVLDAEGNVQYYTRPFISVEVPAGKSAPVSFTGNVGNLPAGDYLAGIATIDAGGTPTLVDYDSGGNVTELTVKNAPSAVPETETDRPALYVADGVLHLPAGTTGEVRIYSLTGLLLYQADVAEQPAIPLACGLYVVQLDGLTEKVVVR